MTRAERERGGASPRRGMAEPVSLADLERWTMLAAYVVSLHGPVYAPILYRLEGELAEARRAQNPVEYARRYMEAHTVDGGVRQIR